MVVVTKTVTLGISVKKQPTLQHFIWRGSDAGDSISWNKGGLLHFSEKILRVAVQLHHTHFDQRVVLVRPNFGEINGW